MHRVQTQTKSVLYSTYPSVAAGDQPPNRSTRTTPTSLRRTRHVNKGAIWLWFLMKFRMWFWPKKTWTDLIIETRQLDPYVCLTTSRLHTVFGDFWARRRHQNRQLCGKVVICRGAYIKMTSFPNNLTRFKWKEIDFSQRKTSSQEEEMMSFFAVGPQTQVMLRHERWQIYDWKLFCW